MAAATIFASSSVSRVMVTGRKPGFSCSKFTADSFHNRYRCCSPWGSLHRRGCRSSQSSDTATITTNPSRPISIHSHPKWCTHASRNSVILHQPAGVYVLMIRLLVGGEVGVRDDRIPRQIQERVLQGLVLRARVVHVARQGLDASELDADLSEHDTQRASTRELRSPPHLVHGFLGVHQRLIVGQELQELFDLLATHQLKRAMRTPA